MAIPALQLKVVRVSQLTPEISSFHLEHPLGQSLPTFTPGAHIDVHLPNDVTRQYSICSHPADSSHYLIAVKHEPNSRGGSKAMHEISVGSLLTIGSPRNNFPICNEAQFHLLLAGGIGITPLLSMARHLQLTHKPFRLEYFSRSVENTAFYNEILGEMGTQVGFNIGLRPDDVRERLADILHHQPEGAHAYICGPAVFISMATEIASQNWATETVHLEHFSAQPIVGQTENRPFRVTLAQSNQQFDIPADKSILDVLRENRVPCDSSCREGTCGSCMVAVLHGDVEHRDTYLSAKEKEQGDVMMICVSRAKTGDLTIDL